MTDPTGHEAERDGDSGWLDFNDVAPGPVRFDLDAIADRLRRQAEHWVPRLFPNGRRVGDEWRLANIDGAAPRKNGSCVIALDGPNAGDWYDFDAGRGGGPLSTLEKATGHGGRALYAYAAELVGWTSDRPGKANGAGGAPRADSTRDPGREIAFIVDRTVPIAGTVAEAYLAARGLAPPACDDLRFHPSLTYWDTRTGHPGLVALLRSGEGEVVAIHRTYLAADGAAKADVHRPRMMLGPVAGAALRLAPLTDQGALALGEGLETCLSVLQAVPELPVWAALSTSNLAQVTLPPEAARIVLLADHDEAGAGMRAAERAALRLHGEGRRVWIALPPEKGDDFNDLLRREGPEAVRTAVEAAVEWTPDWHLDDEEGPEPDPVTGSHQPFGFRLPSAPLPMLRGDDGDLARLAGRSWGLVRTNNQPPWLYRFASRPAWVERDDDGLPAPMQLNEDRLRYVLARLAAWRRMSKRHELVPTHPPSLLVKDMLATPDPALPVLAGIVTAPVFGSDGTLVTEPGYHPATRLLYQPLHRFDLPAVSERPSTDEIAAARDLLLDDLLGEFPFVAEPERAHVLALMLLPFLRPLIHGPTPLHLVEKPSPGTGATLMVDAIAHVITGIGASVMVEGRDEDEWRKRLTAKLRSLPALLLVDNLRLELDSSSLAAALTAPFWEDRVLGKSETIRFPIRCAWVATGNNPKISNEIARRSVRIRLDARVDRPWRRKGFRHKKLLAWVQENRGRLVAACLTLGCAWLAAGRPMGEATIGSFEAWAEVVGGVLEVAGVPGFLGNLEELYEASDNESAVWRAFVGLWWDRFGSAEVRTADLYELAPEAEPPLPLGVGAAHSQRVKLGQALSDMRDRVFDVGQLQVRLRSVGEKRRAQVWTLEVQGYAATTGAEDASAGTPGGECVSVGPPHSHPHSPGIREPNQTAGECGESGESLYPPYARARARAREKEPRKRLTRLTALTNPRKRNGFWR